MRVGVRACGAEGDANLCLRILWGGGDQMNPRTGSYTLLWSKPWQTSIYFFGISSYNRSPETKIKHSTSKPSIPYATYPL